MRPFGGGEIERRLRQQNTPLLPRDAGDLLLELRVGDTLVVGATILRHGLKLTPIESCQKLAGWRERLAAGWSVHLRYGPPAFGSFDRLEQRGIYPNADDSTFRLERIGRRRRCDRRHPFLQTASDWIEIEPQ